MEKLLTTTDGKGSPDNSQASRSPSPLDKKTKDAPAPSPVHSGVAVSMSNPALTNHLSDVQAPLLSASKQKPITDDTANFAVHLSHRTKDTCRDPANLKDFSLNQCISWLIAHPIKDDLVSRLAIGYKVNPASAIRPLKKACEEFLISEGALHPLDYDEWDKKLVEVTLIGLSAQLLRWEQASAALAAQHRIFRAYEE